MNKIMHYGYGILFGLFVFGFFFTPSFAHGMTISQLTHDKSSSYYNWNDTTMQDLGKTSQFKTGSMDVIMMLASGTATTAGNGTMAPELATGFGGGFDGVAADTVSYITQPDASIKMIAHWNNYTLGAGSHLFIGINCTSGICTHPIGYMGTDDAGAYPLVDGDLYPKGFGNHETHVADPTVFHAYVVVANNESGAPQTDNAINFLYPYDYAVIAGNSFTTRLTFTLSPLVQWGLLGTQLHVRYTRTDLSTTTQPYWQKDINQTFSFADTEYSITMTLPNGTYNGKAWFSIFGQDYYVVTSTTGILIKGTTANPLPTGQDTSIADMNALEQLNNAKLLGAFDVESCTSETFFSSAGLGCTVRNLIRFAFVPSSSSTDVITSQFMRIKDVFPFVIPFGALANVQQQISALASTTPDTAGALQYEGTPIFSITSSSIAIHYGSSTQSTWFTMQANFFYLMSMLASVSTAIAVI